MINNQNCTSNISLNFCPRIPKIHIHFTHRMRLQIDVFLRFWASGIMNYHMHSLKTLPTIIEQHIHLGHTKKSLWTSSISHYYWMLESSCHPYIVLPNFVDHLTRKPHARTIRCKCKITRFNLASRETGIKRFLAWMRSGGYAKPSEPAGATSRDLPAANRVVRGGVWNLRNETRDVIS